MSDVPKTEGTVEVVTVGTVTKHPNADTLSMTLVAGYPVLFRTGDFHEGDRGVYVPVDSLVPVSRPEFSFLRKGDAERHRIRAVRLRGVFSMGLLVPPPAGSEPGQDVTAELGITRWVPPSERRANALSQGTKPMRDPGFMPVYGLDALRKLPDVLLECEPVVITEKIHGCNARFCYRNGRLWVGSHRAMRGVSRSRVGELLNSLKLRFFDLLGRSHRAHLHRDAGDVWWQTAEKYDLKAKLATRPDCVLYGEIYGQSVQDLTYDSPTGRRFAAFDVLDLAEGRYLSRPELEDFCRGLDLPIVPVLYAGPWSDGLKDLANGPTTLGGGHLREGIVVKPAIERVSPMCGRVALKYVSEAYLLRTEKEAT